MKNIFICMNEEKQQMLQKESSHGAKEQQWSKGAALDKRSNNRIMEQQWSKGAAMEQRGNIGPKEQRQGDSSRKAANKIS